MHTIQNNNTHIPTNHIHNNDEQNSTTKPKFHPKKTQLKQPIHSNKQNLHQQYQKTKYQKTKEQNPQHQHLSPNSL